MVGLSSIYKLLFNAFLLLCLTACNFFSPKRFTQLGSQETGIDFVNKLTPTKDLNIFNYLYYYDGGGVAAGDFNGDGLPDLYFTSNQESNKLYLNKSNMKFEDITNRSFPNATADDWTTGVSVVDINDDGRLDIYVCTVGKYLKIRGKNKLYINQGNTEAGTPLFKEEAQKYGLDLVGYGTQAAFFDYDLDGDLDMYMMNHSVHSNGTFDYSTIRKKSHPLAGDKLMKNENGKFTEATKEAGIYNSALGYGLGIGISDLNKDGYPDIYIGNDFHEDDYLYINNGDGTFSESLGQMIQHTSRSSMGNDLVDINNDGMIDILSVDMLPSDYKMLKASAGEDPYKIMQSKLEYGYKYQFSRNTLQLNRGNGNFSEVGLLSGIDATDWSWSVLGADFNNNGFTDVFISNGIQGRSNDMDYIEFISRDSIQNRLRGQLTNDDLKLTDKMPKVQIPNVMYKNEGSLCLKDVSAEWGIDQKTYSNGAVYADLDLDGDLDIVVNNVDQKASVYRNNSVEQFEHSNYLEIKLKGPPGNRMGIGTRLDIFLGKDNMITRENYPVRGYQSSMACPIHIGLDSLNHVPELRIRWPDGKSGVLRNVKANQTLMLSYEDTSSGPVWENQSADSIRRLFRETTNMLQISYEHKENQFVEFHREALMPFMLSTAGPALAIGDVNGDSRDDLYVGGAKRQAAELFLQKKGGTFDEMKNPVFENDFVYEDVDATFGDFDQDGDQDLLVVSGGNEYYGHSEYMEPRLYINDGQGHFTRSKSGLPDLFLTGSVVAKADIDGDNDLDLFIGARAIPWKYGMPPTSYLLINEKGNFKVDSTSFGKAFSNLGLVKEARWADMDNDGSSDLVVASEWSPLQILYTAEGKAIKKVVELPRSTGLWNTITLLDLNQDGSKDIVAGNLGLNSKFQASDYKPLKMYVNDFDGNGSLEQIITYIDNTGKERLFAERDALTQQLSYFKDKFPTYWSFAKASLNEVIDEDLLDQAQTYAVDELRSCIFYNNGEHGFSKQYLPMQAQFTPLYSFLTYDFNGDRYPDLIGAGNFYEATPQQGRYDAGFGTLLLNNGKKGVRVIPNRYIDWFLKGQVRTMEKIKIKNKEVMIIAENNKPLRFFQVSKGSETEFVNLAPL